MEQRQLHALNFTAVELEALVTSVQTSKDVIFWEIYNNANLEDKRKMAGTVSTISDIHCVVC